MVDATTLPHERILFVSTSGNGHCLSVGVYEQKGKGYREVWSVEEMPSGAGFCHESPCTNPTASATKKGEVTITFPFRDKDANVEDCDHVRVFAYRPNQKTYQLASEQTAPARCGLETYQRALDIVFGHAINGERVATVEILPSFEPETAIAFERTPNGLMVNRITFRKQLWLQLGLGAPGPAKTPSQCIGLAKAADVERAFVTLPRESAQRFIDDLAGMDFITDRCPRYKEGTCAYVLDGVNYIVHFEDGPSARLTDVSASSGMRSENPALSSWVMNLLREIGPPAPK
jgi:hypothetical protein